MANCKARGLRYSPGLVIGPWTLICRAATGRGKWICRCACGAEVSKSPHENYRAKSCRACHLVYLQHTANGGGREQPIILDPNRVRLPAICKAVATHFQIGPKDLRSRWRHRPISRPRQLVYVLAMELTTHSKSDLGRRLGGRDHSTIYHGIKAANARMSSDPAWAQHYADVKAALQPVAP